MWRISLLLLVFMVFVPMGCEQRGNYFTHPGEEEPHETELHNVSLAVASVMAAPQIPVHDLSVDPRIVSYVSCGTPLIIPEPNANDDQMEIYGYTRNANMFVVPHPNSDVYPFIEYHLGNTFENWYCVHPNGTVVGFTYEMPHTNIDDL